MAKKYVQNPSSVSRHAVFLERRFLQIKASLNDASDGRIGEGATKIFVSRVEGQDFVSN